MASVELSEIVKDYGTVRAVHGVNLTIEDGELVVFVGPSGCGKSTLLRMIAGLEEITAGTLKIGERVVNQVEPRARDVAMVFQDYALYPHMSVAANIGFGLRMRNVGAAEIDRSVREAAAMLQVEHLLDRKPGQLSGGQRQRVAMGRAIVRKPSVFLFDEPLSNLDAKLRVEMRTQIKRLHEILKTTTVYVTHDQVEAMTLADRIVILRDGVIEQDGAPIDVYARPANRFVGEFIGSPQMNLFEAVIDRSSASPVLKVGDVRVDAAVPQSGGNEILLGIRPEHFEVADGASMLEGEIDVIEPLGSDTMVICRMGSNEFTARLPADLPVARGQTVGLSVDARRMHFFDKGTGARIS